MQAIHSFCGAGNSRFEWNPPHELLEAASGEPFAVASPWVICGGRVSATFGSQSRASSNGASQCSIELSVNPAKWNQIWSGSCDSGAHVDAEFDDLLQSYQMPNQGVYNYSLLFTLNDGNVKLESLTIVTDVMAHPLSLPRLNLGSNEFKYSDDSSTRDILIEHRCLLRPVSHSSEKKQPMLLDVEFLP